MDACEYSSVQDPNPDANPQGLKYHTAFISNNELPRTTWDPIDPLLSFSPSWEVFPSRNSQRLSTGGSFLFVPNRNPNPIPSFFLLADEQSESNLPPVRGHLLDLQLQKPRPPRFRAILISGSRPLGFASSPFVVDHAARMGPGSRANPRRTITRVSNWNFEKSPYVTLGNFPEHHFLCSCPGSN
ncbi:hypothetical protein B296_00016948 [Ensete ventricosum]|uniref:Uncharacterized protein n=1 Tax=Ensete ventricosum TaxID=4639 RepID=A0A427B327_ENSVE|nr:hypothetical protein B296_00016948 [Ensete ventricosum]